VTLTLPFTPLGAVFGFGPLPILFLVLIAMIVAGYIVTAEMVKTVFYKKVKL
jgi:Mg2+-importing ATPase